MSLIVPDEMQAIIESIAIKDSILKKYTPEAMEKTIGQLVASDKDHNNKLSPEEAGEYLKKISKPTPTAGGIEDVIFDIHNDTLCRNAGMANVESSRSKEELERIRADAVGELQFLRDVASIAKAPLKTAQEKDQLKEKEDKIIYSYSEIVSRNLMQVAGKMPYGDATATTLTREILEKAKSSLQGNPKLLKEIHDMPDFSELGKLDANHVCKSLTNKGLGIQA